MYRFFNDSKNHLRPWGLILSLTVSIVACSGGSGFSGSSGREPKERKASPDDRTSDAGTGGDRDKTRSAKSEDSQAEQDKPSKAPANAIKKGSFTAWTDPPKPQPGERYLIVIEVGLPGNTTSYSIKDLEGTVRGTDGFRRTFGSIEEYWSANLPPQWQVEFNYTGGSRATVSVPIPGAAYLVKDSISIKSELLAETQELVIQFGE